MEYKKLKDPLYGYIAVPEDIMHGIVDSAAFQRLRRISQTSYAPLYSSAMHNRFVHSLGVYHLGKIASDSLVREIKRKIQSDLNVERLQEVFLLACLLHDVGHAPFSHTGEVFYLDTEGDCSHLHNILKENVSDEQLANDVDSIRKSAAPHEIMSAIVGLKTFSAFFPLPAEKGFFARCITGYQYLASSPENSVRNCFIQLLNSKTIDVDKLDYLIRDSYITGYDTIRIDYQRLLNAITIITNDGGASYRLAYSKGAVSVIENVIYAHDSERKWIQTHPVILYENNQLTRIMRMLSDKYDTELTRLFSLEAISEEGVVLEENEKVCLLCDDDIIHLMKKYYPDDHYVREYFNRNERCHPIWKSEAEYKAYLYEKIQGGEILENMEYNLLAAAEYLRKDECGIVNEKLINDMQLEISQLKEMPIDKPTAQKQIKQIEKNFHLFNLLLHKAQEKHCPGEFVLLMASQFKSGFLKPDFENIEIVLDHQNNKTFKFHKIASSLTGRKEEREDGKGEHHKNTFYLYYRRNGAQKVDWNSEELLMDMFKNYM